MDADSATPRYIPHNRVAGYRLTTLGVADHHPIHALDAHTLGRAPDLVDEPVERAGLRRLDSPVSVRIELLQYLSDVHIALADRRHQMVHVHQVQRPRHFQQVGVFRLCQTPPLDLPIEDLAAKLDRGRVLLDAQALTDL